MSGRTAGLTAVWAYQIRVKDLLAYCREVLGQPCPANPALVAVAVVVPDGLRGSGVHRPPYGRVRVEVHYAVPDEASIPA
jgi:hypothetical protein